MSEVVNEVIDTEQEVSNEEIPSEQIDNGPELESDRQEAESQKLTYEELEAKYKELEEKNRNAEEIAKRLKDEKSQQNREASEQERTAEQEAAKQDFINNNLQSFIENGMVATPEQLEEAAKHGITPEQIKLAAYEAKENTNRVYGIVGGQEEYNAMMDFMRDKLTDAQKEEYTKAVFNPNTSSYAVKGLYADYLALSGKTPQQNQARIQPNVTKQSSGGGYNNIQEYYADMRTMRSLPTQQQKAYYEKINAKMNRSNLV